MREPKWRVILWGTQGVDRQRLAAHQAWIVAGPVHAAGDEDCAQGGECGGAEGDGGDEGRSAEGNGGDDGHGD